MNSKVWRGSACEYQADEQAGVAPRGFFKATKKCQSRSGTSLVGPVVKNLPSNAGDVGSIPGQGIKTPHGKGKLSHRPQVLILSPCTLEPLTYNEREDCTPQQSLLATAKTQCNQINKNSFKGSFLGPPTDYILEEVIF